MWRWQRYVWRFIQQNHDGLPQKAGVPQHIMNEIHGAWFDPSNPVVAMSGNLRTDLFSDLLRCEREADLVMAIGTSLSGMNADRVVSTVASKARGKGKKPLGSVIVSLQSTPHDANSSLRIYALIDDVMSLLAEELGVQVTPQSISNATGDTVHQPDPLITKLVGAKKVDVDVFSVPYDLDGNRAQEHRVLDLREGARVKVTEGPNKGQFASVVGRNADGHWRLRITHAFKTRSDTQRATPATFGEVRLLGSWWPVAAAKGELESIPVMTVPDAAEAS